MRSFFLSPSVVMTIPVSLFICLVFGLIHVHHISFLEHIHWTRRQYAFSPFINDGSESGGEMKRNAYVSEDMHEAERLQGHLLISRARFKDAFARHPLWVFLCFCVLRFPRFPNEEFFFKVFYVVFDYL